ncbi:MAG: metal ABC transporter substrate-binding protein [Dehalococcoidales bacterium]|nr:metal ABC transporter substrate-binding protein [Dehalococcoidales bacterium]
MRKFWLILILPILLLSLTGCQPLTSASDGKISIVATYSILGAIVKDIVGDKASVTVAIPNGLDIHEWEPSAKDIEAINKADLVVRNGLGLEGGLEKTLETAQNSGVRIFTAIDHIDVRHVGSGEGVPSDDPDQAVGAPDPHLWTNPLAVKRVVNALAVEFQTVFNLDVASRTADMEKRLDALDRQIENILSAVHQENRKLVTGHESLGYFAQRYNFKLIGVIIPSLSTQAQVSARDLAALKQLISEHHVQAIFTELGTPAAVAQSIGAETGARIIELNTHILPEDGSYFTFMNEMANTVAEALKQ